MYVTCDNEGTFVKPNLICVLYYLVGTYFKHRSITLI